MKAELNDESWLTMYAHCLKHITSDCYGLLLGAQLDHDFEITHVVPLTHSRITLPSLELAFQIVAEYAFEKDLKILGLYECQVYENEGNPSALGKLLGEKIQVGLSEMLIIVLEVLQSHTMNTQLNRQLGHFHPIAISASSGKNEDILQTAISQTKLEKCIKEHNYLFVDDVDDHLNDITKDFTNLQFLKLF